MTHPKALPPCEDLRKDFKYDPDTGDLYRLTKNGDYKLCTSKCAQGYGRLKYKGTYYKASRIIWRLVTGEDPGCLTIDHINRNRSDNRLSNIRLADHCLQKQNRGILSTSTTKLKGAFKSSSKYGKPFKSAIMRNGLRISLGSFDTAEEAHAAYRQAGGIP